MSPVVINGSRGENKDGTVTDVNHNALYNNKCFYLISVKKVYNTVIIKK